MTGQIDSKFGFALETGEAMDGVKAAIAAENIDFKGIHCHIGSQIFDVEPFERAAEVMIGFMADIKAETGVEVEELDLGGGYGVRYIEDQPEIDIAANIALVAKKLKAKAAELGIELPHIYMEPGRSIVADAGMTLYTAGTVKKIPGYKNYVAIDGGMSDNPRYALYNSSYTVLCANKMNEAPSYNCTIAGRLCESGDLIQENVQIPPVKRGDNIAVLVTGAYNYSMSSNYNRINRPLVLMLGDKIRVAINREKFEDVSKLDEFLD
jgi:diaminopimelate decarboxylase